MLILHIRIDRWMLSLITIINSLYYHKYRGYHKIHYSKTCTSIKYFHFIFAILVPVVVAVK